VWCGQDYCEACSTWYKEPFLLLLFVSGGVPLTDDVRGGRREVHVEVLAVFLRCSVFVDNGDGENSGVFFHL
jgi:hypothetical protein